MRVRLYLDEDAMGEGLIRALRSKSVDLLTATEADMVERPDSEHPAFATAQGRALYSYNRPDYMVLNTQLLTEGKSHAGIILSDQSAYDVGEQMRRLVRLTDTLTAEEMQNRVEFLSAWGE